MKSFNTIPRIHFHLILINRQPPKPLAARVDTRQDIDQRAKSGGNPQNCGWSDFHEYNQSHNVGGRIHLNIVTVP